MPLHILLTDLIDSQGGSYELIRILNRLGAVASVRTVSCGAENVCRCSPEPRFESVHCNIRVDNIEFLQRHSFVYSGDQGRSWHGTTIQVVQPLPAQETGNMDEDWEDSGRNPNYVCSPKGSMEENLC